MEDKPIWHSYQFQSQLEEQIKKEARQWLRKQLNSDNNN